MSPNVCLWIIGTAALIFAILGAVHLAIGKDKRKPAYSLTGLFLFCFALFVIWAGIDFHRFATGDSHYEKLDNPDGTRTWQRVEVTK